MTHVPHTENKYCSVHGYQIHQDDVCPHCADEERLANMLAKITQAVDDLTQSWPVDDMRPPDAFALLPEADGVLARWLAMRATRGKPANLKHRSLDETTISNVG